MRDLVPLTNATAARLIASALAGGLVRVDENPLLGETTMRGRPGSGFPQPSRTRGVLLAMARWHY